MLERNTNPSCSDSETLRMAALYRNTKMVHRLKTTDRQANRMDFKKNRDLTGLEGRNKKEKVNRFTHIKVNLKHAKNK